MHSAAEELVTADVGANLLRELLVTCLLPFVAMTVVLLWARTRLDPQGQGHSAFPLLLY